MTKEKKIDFVFDLNEHLKNEIKNSKYVKATLIVVACVGGLYCLGFVFKVMNYTTNNFKNLNATLKR